MNPLALAARPRGRASQEAGDDAEALVDRVHALPSFAERWHLQRRYPRQQGGRYTAPQGPDFSGWRRADGRHVEVEVKLETEGRLALERLRPSQVETLRACARDGGIAIVLVLYGPHLSRALWCPVPWPEIEPRYDAWRAWIDQGGDRRSRGTVDRARASLSETEIVRHRAEPPRYLEAWG